MNTLLCPKCKTGAESYRLDPKSPMCPYLQYHNVERCPFFVPIKDGFRCHALDGVDITVFHVHQLADGRGDFSGIAAILIEDQATFGILINPARRLAAHDVLIAVVKDVETSVL